MGIIRDAKANTLAKQAAEAREKGQPVFAAVLNSPAFRPDFSGEVVDWSMMLAAIEAEGWVLYNWSAGSDPKGRPQAYPLFRRAQ